MVLPPNALRDVTPSAGSTAFGNGRASDEEAIAVVWSTENPLSVEVEATTSPGHLEPLGDWLSSLIGRLGLSGFSA